MAWFETWFDSPYYPVLYKHRDSAEAEKLVNQIVKQFPVAEFPNVLDAACGKGRHALNLAQKGYKVEAFDLAPTSIAEAQGLVNESVDLIFKVHNILDTFAFDKFDLVTNLFTSFGYFETEIDDMRALRALHDSLNSGGYLIQDFLNTNLVEEDEDWKLQTIDGIVFETKKEIENNKVVKSIKVLDKGETYNFKESVSLFKLQDFERMYKAVGFKIKHVFGDYDFNEFDPHTSPRLIMIAAK